MYLSKPFFFNKNNKEKRDEKDSEEDNRLQEELQSDRNRTFAIHPHKTEIITSCNQEACNALFNVAASMLEEHGRGYKIICQ